MASITSLHDQSWPVDILAEDREGRAVLAVEVKGRVLSPPEVREQRGRLLRLAGRVPFAMLVDPEVIRLYRLRHDRTVRLGELKTQSVLRAYDPKIGHKSIHEIYLVGLIDAWLRDLAYGWRYAQPIGASELRAVGLLPWLAEGTTRREVVVRGPALP